MAHGSVLAEELGAGGAIEGGADQSKAFALEQPVAAPHVDRPDGAFAMIGNQMAFHHGAKVPQAVKFLQIFAGLVAANGLVFLGHEVADIRETVGLTIGKTISQQERRGKI